MSFRIRAHPDTLEQRGFFMKKRTKAIIFSVLALVLIGGVSGAWVVKKLRSAEYAYNQGISALDRGDGDAHVRWMSVAGARGDVRAQMYLATSFETGALGGVTDLKSAAAWYKKAAESGNAVAQFNFGTFCWLGRGGVPADRAQAVEWWKRAAESGLPNAKSNLGICYRDGLEVKKDINCARELFIDAASANHREAQYLLGELYERENNRERALYWLEKAASAGHQKAKTHFERLTGTHL